MNASLSTSTARYLCFGSTCNIFCTIFLANGEMDGQLQDAKFNRDSPMRFRIQFGVSAGPEVNGVCLCVCVFVKDKKNRKKIAIIYVIDFISRKLSKQTNKNESKVVTIPCQHGVQQNTHTPNITCLIVALFF